MKKLRLLAWLLVVAVLSLACPVLGEEAGIEITDALAPELSEDFELDETGDDIEIADSGEAMEDIDIPLTDPDLSDAPDITLDVALDDALDSVADEAPVEGLAANGNGSKELFRRYQSKSSYDNDALFAGYVDMLFGKKNTLGLKVNAGAGEQLKGMAADMYNYLCKQVKKVAEGTLSDTRVVIPSSIVPDYDAAITAYEVLDKYIGALLVDFPYHMFWYDKVQGCYFMYQDGVATVGFTVAQEYATGTYEADTEKIQSAHVAVTNAKKVVTGYAGSSDYNKLCGYRDYICKEVSYNNDAAAQMYSYDGNAWQLIWAFDKDPDTNIVCEGYSKAFQYLCDLSSFSSAIQCHIVSGDVDQGYGPGAHMWNIITMGDGKNYHVDVTFVDTGMPEAFLCGASATGDNNTYCVRNAVYYTLDAGTVSAYPAKTLKLSTCDFDPDSYKAATPTPTPTATPAPTAAAKVSLSKCKLTVKDQVYANKLLKPAVTVKYDSKTLKKGTDYTVTYANNRVVGKATATVKGKGQYTGTKKVTFKILPPAVKLSKLTAKKNSFTATWKKGTANTGYQLQYGLKKTFAGAKTVKVTKATTVMTTVKSLLKGKTYYVRVRAYKTVGKVNYYSAWSSVKSVKVK